MAAPFSVTPNIGADFNSITLAADIASNSEKGDCRLGEQRFGSDGKLYVYAQANATITADTAVAAVDPDTFLVAATGGAYASPGVDMAAGDRGWFGKASV